MSSLFARFTSLEGGMNSGFDPAVISEKQYYIGTNVVSRRGRPHTRPDFDKMNLVFASPVDKALFEDGRFQGSREYTPGDAAYLVVMIGGYCFTIDTSTWKVTNHTTWTEESPVGVKRMNSLAPRCYFCQVVDYMIVQDGSSRPIIFNGLQARHSVFDDDEVPAGTNMAFGHGRLFLQISKRNFIAGDIYQYIEPESVLKFTEDKFLSEGGSFSVYPTLGGIVGLKFATHYDTSTGDGPLFILCDNGIASYAVNISRAKWNDSDISKIQLVGTGVVGPDALTDINQDLMFWSWQGLRSWSTVKLEASYRRKYTNQSAEMAIVAEDSTPWLLPYTSMIQFGNRLLITSVGEKAQCKVSVPWSAEEELIYADVAFKAIISLDFDQINNQVTTETSQAAQTASFDGIWTGIHPTQLVAINIGSNQRAFAFDKSSSGKNRLWEITERYTGLDNGTSPIEASICTKSYAAIDSQYIQQPFVMKRLSSARIWLSGLRMNTPVEFHVKNETSRNYTHLQTRELNIATWQKDLKADNTIQSGFPVNVGVVPFEDFIKAQSPVTDTLVYSGHELSFMIRWRGYAELSRMIAEMTNDGELRFMDDPNETMVYDPPQDKYKYRV